MGLRMTVRLTSRDRAPWSIGGIFCFCPDGWYLKESARDRNKQTTR